MQKCFTSYRGLLLTYIILSLCLLLYSYSQVDLNLTLSKTGFWQSIQKSFQYLGYFNRPLSAKIFVVIILLYYAAYGLLLRSVLQHNLSSKQLWIIIVLNSFILLWSYPAFSYDFFNYMFTAKMVLLYQKNPYIIIPRDFAGFDAWLNFLRWTHLPSAYTPFWIGLSLIPFYFGFGFFLLTMWNFKLLLAVFYLLTAWAIKRVMSHDIPKISDFSLAVFALNPLVFIESVVSPHNDIVMMAFVMIALYLFIVKSQVLTHLMLALSVASKLMTIFIYPIVYLFKWNRSMLIGVMALAVLTLFIKREILPWYFLWVMPFIALKSDQKNIIILASGISLGLILRYTPYLYYGDYSQQSQSLRMPFMVIPVLLSLGWVFIRSRLNK
jgi:hypothetical protein